MSGQVATLRDLFWHKEEPWGVLQLASGTRIAIPLSWTDIPKNVFPSRKESPQIDALRLLEMARFLQPRNAQTRKPTKQKRQRTSNKIK